MCLETWWKGWKSKDWRGFTNVPVSVVQCQENTAAPISKETSGTHCWYQNCPYICSKVCYHLMVIKVCGWESLGKYISMVSGPCDVREDTKQGGNGSGCQWMISRKLSSGMFACYCIVHSCACLGLGWDSTPGDGADETQSFPVVKRKGTLACQKCMFVSTLNGTLMGACRGFTIQKLKIFPCIVFCLPSSIPGFNKIKWTSTHPKVLLSTFFLARGLNSCQELDNVKEKKKVSKAARPIRRSWVKIYSSINLNKSNCLELCVSETGEQSRKGPLKACACTDDYMGKEWYEVGSEGRIWLEGERRRHSKCVYGHGSCHSQWRTYLVGAEKGRKLYQGGSREFLEAFVFHAVSNKTHWGFFSATTLHFYIDPILWFLVESRNTLK